MTGMDWVKAALQNAKLEDLIRMAEWADSAEEWDRAVNELVRATNG